MPVAGGAHQLRVPLGQDQLAQFLCSPTIGVVLSGYLLALLRNTRREVGDRRLSIAATPSVTITSRSPGLVHRRKMGGNLAIKHRHLLRNVLRRDHRRFAARHRFNLGTVDRNKRATPTNDSSRQKRMKLRHTSTIAFTRVILAEVGYVLNAGVEPCTSHITSMRRPASRSSARLDPEPSSRTRRCRASTGHPRCITLGRPISSATTLERQPHLLQEVQAVDQPIDHPNRMIGADRLVQCRRDQRQLVRD